MKKNKHGWDVLESLWDKWESFYDGTHAEETQNMSWEGLINSVSPIDMEEYAKQIVLEHFLFEIKYLIHKPDYTSMRYLWGEHAMLYDVFACYEHRFVIVTHDDREDGGQTIFCPYCNEDKFGNSEKMEKYIRDVGGKTDTPEMWGETLKMAKWWQALRRKENFKYRFHKWTERGYLKYRIMKFLGLIKKSK